MSVDVFGHSLSKSDGLYIRGLPGIGFEMTKDGQYDMQNKRICNLADSVLNNDAVTFNTLKTEINNVKRECIDKINKVKNESTDEIKSELQNEIDTYKRELYYAKLEVVKLQENITNLEKQLLNLVTGIGVFNDNDKLNLHHIIINNASSRT